MNTIDFENRLDDLTFDINAELKNLDPDVAGEDDKVNLLQEIKKEICNVHSSLLKYRKKLTHN